MYLYSPLSIMDSYTGVLDRHPIFPILAKLSDKLELHTYVVGGFVRDLFLGRPSKDIDIVCIGDAIPLAEALTEAMKLPPPAIFRKFGTAMVRVGDVEIEFVTARKESYSPESRKPCVSPGSLLDDQKRRDFTVNAISIELAPTYGALHMPFSAEQDLAQKVLRTPLDPAETFHDDPLRMMRAVRFVVQLGFSLDPKVEAAMTTEHERLKIVSTERVVEELNKILVSSDPKTGLELLDRTGLLAHILPELQTLKGVERRGRHAHKDNFLHTLEVVQNTVGRSDSLWLRWAALLHDIAKPRTKRFDPRHGFTFHGHEELGARMVPGIFRRLRLPLQKPMRYVEKLVRLHLRPIALSQEAVTDAAIRRLVFDAGEELEDLIILCRADITSKNWQRAAAYQHNFDKVMQKVQEVAARDYVRTFQPVLDGNQIMHLFHIQPGREIGILKSKMKEAILDGMLENEYDACYAFITKEAAKLGLYPAEGESHAPESP